MKSTIEAKKAGECDTPPKKQPKQKADRSHLFNPDKYKDWMFPANKMQG